MLRWSHIFGALMLVLMLWTGAAAEASRSLDVVPVAPSALGHFEGDID